MTYYQLCDVSLLSVLITAAILVSFMVSLLFNYFLFMFLNYHARVSYGLTPDLCSVSSSHVATNILHPPTLVTFFFGESILQPIREALVLRCDWSSPLAGLALEGINRGQKFGRYAVCVCVCYGIKITSSW